MDTVKPTFEPLYPLTRNNAFIAIQAAMIAVVKDDPTSARRCIEIALDSISIWDNK